MTNIQLQRLKYVAGDLVSSAIAVLLYNIARYWLGSERIVAMHGFATLQSFLLNDSVMMGQLLFPLAMMGVYYLSGYYTEVIRKSRLQEFVTTLITSLISALIVFFVAVINDLVSERAYNYEMIVIFWLISFVMVYSVRLFFTNKMAHKIKTGKLLTNVMIIGAGEKAAAFGADLAGKNRSLGYDVVGYVSIGDEKPSEKLCQPVYALDRLKDVCDTVSVSEFIIIPERHDTKTILHTVNALFPLNRPIKIKPDIYNILVSRVRLSDFHGEPLIDISGSCMGYSATNIKRVADCVLSALALVLLMPLFVYVAYRIKRESEGGVLYKQTRIGLHNRPFTIYKFRTMRVDAEKDGVPRLSSSDDDRITPFGKVMRKYRIDELPQFWNVLKGDMSIVGPRPEREYFIEQITQRAPFYTLLHQVRPGITSMGMVKFGYAGSVDEMVERMKYDLIYLENMSLLNDLKIMVYTIETVLTGKGI
ncbi:MAG: sugar transferase [Muribaculaceae bacterium]